MTTNNDMIDTHSTLTFTEAFDLDYNDDDTMMTPTKLSEAVQTVLDGERNKDLNQASAGFRILFEEVQDPENWKNPVDAKVDLDQFAGYDIADVVRTVRLAIEFYTGSMGSFEVHGREISFRALGYYAVIGA